MGLAVSSVGGFAAVGALTVPATLVLSVIGAGCDTAKGVMEEQAQDADELAADAAADAAALKEEEEALLAQSTGDAALQFALRRAKPRIVAALPRLKPPLNGLTWEDVEPAVQKIDSVEELKRAASDPDAFLMDLFEDCVGPVAVRLALAALRPVLEPKLRDKFGLPWEAVEGALGQIESVEQIKAAMEDPDAFLESLATACGDAAVRFAIARLKPKLEPRLKDTPPPLGPLAWEHVEPALLTVDSAAQIRAALESPAAFLEELLRTMGDVGVRIAIARVRPKLEPKLKKAKLEWSDIEPVLEELDTVDELIAACTDDAARDALLERLLNQTQAVALRVAIRALQAKLEPKLQKKGIAMADVQPLLDEIDTVAEVEEALADPEAFLARLAGKSAGFVIALLRPKLEKMFAAPPTQRGALVAPLVWADAEEALRCLTMDDFLQLKEAMVGDDDLSKVDAAEVWNALVLKSKAWWKGGEDKTKMPDTVYRFHCKLLLALSRHKLEPRLPKPLVWADMKPALALIDMNDNKTNGAVVKLLLQISRRVHPDLQVSPNECLRKIIETGGPAACKIAAAYCRPAVEPKLPAGVAWSDVQPAIDALTSEDDLLVAINEPEAFVKGTLAGSRGVIIALARPALEKKLPRTIRWSEASVALAALADDELKTVLDDPTKFLAKLAFGKPGRVRTDASIDSDDEGTATASAV